MCYSLNKNLVLYSFHLIFGRHVNMQISTILLYNMRLLIYTLWMWQSKSNMCFIALNFMIDLWFLVYFYYTTLYQLKFSRVYKGFLIIISFSTILAR